MRRQKTAEGDFFDLLAALRELRDSFPTEEPSDRKLAKIAKVSPTTVGNWLRGQQFPQDVSKFLTIVRTIAARATYLNSIGSHQFSAALVDEQHWKKAYLDEVQRRAEVDSESVRRGQASRTLIRLRSSEESGARNDEPQLFEEPLMPSPEELRRCLVRLGVRRTDVDAAATWVESSVAQNMSPSPIRRPPPFNLARSIDSRSEALARGFLDDLLNLNQPQRMFTSTVYFSHGKVARYFRTHRQAITEAGFLAQVSDQASAAEKFLALHRYLKSRDMVVSATITQLLGKTVRRDSETLTYFKGNFTLIPSGGIGESIPESRETKNGADDSELHGMVARIFATPDPFFYPIVQLSGDFQGRKSVMSLSRKYLEIDSTTSTALGRALRGTALPIAGFGTIEDSIEIQPFVLKLLRKV